MTTIQIEQLVKHYRGRQQPALDHVSLNIQSGMYGLLGKNGAGKSTLMKILTTLEKPTSGKVLVDGTPLKDARSIRRKIGYLPQQFGFYPTMKVIDAMTYLAILAEVPAREQKRRIEWLLAAVHLTAQAKTKVKALSGGMLQRLGIAQALVNEPRVLIVDEPTADWTRKNGYDFGICWQILLMSVWYSCLPILFPMLRQRLIVLASLIMGDWFSMGPLTSLLMRLRGMFLSVTYRWRSLNSLRRSTRLVNKQRTGSIFGYAC